MVIRICNEFRVYAAELKIEYNKPQALNLCLKGDLYCARFRTSTA